MHVSNDPPLQGSVHLCPPADDCVCHLDLLGAVSKALSTFDELRAADHGSWPPQKGLDAVNGKRHQTGPGKDHE